MLIEEADERHKPSFFGMSRNRDHARAYTNRSKIALDQLIAFLRDEPIVSSQNLFVLPVYHLVQRKRHSLTTVVLRTLITQMTFFNHGMLLLSSKHFLIRVTVSVFLTNMHRLWETSWLVYISRQKWWWSSRNERGDTLWRLLNLACID